MNLFNHVNLTPLLIYCQSVSQKKDIEVTLRNGTTDVMSILVGCVVWTVSIMRHCSTNQTYKGLGNSQ